MLGNIFKKRYRRKALETNVYSKNETVLFYAQAADASAYKERSHSLPSTTKKSSVEVSLTDSHVRNMFYI